MSDSYRRCNGRIITTTDEFKYSKYKVKENTTYLRSVLSKGGCKGTTKLKLETDLICPSSIHNHGIDYYDLGVYELETNARKGPKLFKIIKERFSMTKQERVFLKVKFLSMSMSLLSIVLEEDYSLRSLLQL